MSNNPQAPQPVELREKLLLVKKILKLPIRQDSSALKQMDAWAIADFIEQYGREQRIAGLKQYAKQCGILRMEPSTADLRRHISNLEAELATHPTERTPDEQ
jgi:cytochrome c